MQPIRSQIKHISEIHRKWVYLFGGSNFWNLGIVFCDVHLPWTLWVPLYSLDLNNLGAKKMCLPFRSIFQQPFEKIHNILVQCPSWSLIGFIRANQMCLREEVPWLAQAGLVDGDWRVYSRWVVGSGDGGVVGGQGNSQEEEVAPGRWGHGYQLRCHLRANPWNCPQRLILVWIPFLPSL